MLDAEGLATQVCFNSDELSSDVQLADAPILMRTAQSLWLQIGPSLRVVCGRYGTTNLPDKHLEILQAFLDGDAEAAADALQEDLKQGVVLMRQPFAKNFDQNLGENQ